jgi:transcriptional regulator with PAS, ATPase and Fis domain
MTDERTLARTKSTRVKYAKTRISVVHGPDTGLSLELASNAVRIGTASDNDLVLTDQTVSRRHCALLPVAEGVRVTDEGSTNGVLVGGVRLFDAVMHGPQKLTVGESVIALVPLDETVEREQASSDRFGDLLGSSARMRELFADLERLAASEISVLVEGETGTGKELVAESIHANSPRADSPLVVFDCSTVVASLAESELFGHERGAFTGAVTARAGVFEQANGGTIFLDEIGELPKDLQPKLLRVLEKREVRRLGSQRVIPIDVRLIAATHRNLVAEVARGNFRQDLFFRIAAAHVFVPPLRDRMQDLPQLVEHFLARATPPRSLEELSPDVWAMFRAHRWPGNVRELRNAVERLLVTPERALRPLPKTEPSAAPVAVQVGAHLPLREARREASDTFELKYLEAILERTQGNVTRAAAIAEVSRQMIQKLMRKHGIG